MRLLSRPLLLAALLFASMAVHAQYKWTDHDGVVSYGDQPSKDAEHVERLGSLAPADAVRDALARLPFEVRKAAQDFPVVLYARSECQPCDTARAFLKSRNVPYSERSVSTREDIDAFEKSLGGTHILPTLSVGRQVLRGFESGAWSEALATAGYPRDVPLPRDWTWAAATPLAPPPNPAPPPDNTTPPAAGSNADTH